MTIPLRRAHLKIAQPNIFSRDRDRLVSAARKLSGNIYSCPADALPDILCLLGTHFRQARIPYERLAMLPKVNKARYQESAEVGHHFSLAKELAHLRLHLPLVVSGRLTILQDAEASRYAAVFLMPVGLLLKHPAWQSLASYHAISSRELWELTHDLADRCKVSGAAMASRLEDIGLLTLCRETRQLRRTDAA